VEKSSGNGVTGGIGDSTEKWLLIIPIEPSKGMLSMFPESHTMALQSPVSCVFQI
jgi:hypothetical protein